MSDENKVIARKVYEIIDPAAPDNEALPGIDPDVNLIQAFEQFASEARTAFPDLRITVEDVIAEGDRMAARVTMRGTQRGEFQGIAPTGKQVEVRAIDMFHISNGKIVEHWGHADDPTTSLRQLERP